MKKTSYHVNRLLSKWEEDNYRKIMEKKISSAKSTIPSRNGSSKSTRGPRTLQHATSSPVKGSEKSKRIALDDVILDEVQNLVDLLNGERKPSNGQAQKEAPKKPKIPVPKERPPFWLPSGLNSFTTSETLGPREKAAGPVAVTTVSKQTTITVKIKHAAPQAALQPPQQPRRKSSSPMRTEAPKPIRMLPAPSPPAHHTTRTVSSRYNARPSAISEMSSPGQYDEPASPPTPPLPPPHQPAVRQQSLYRQPSPAARRTSLETPNSAVHVPTFNLLSHLMQSEQHYLSAADGESPHYDDDFEPEELSPGHLLDDVEAVRSWGADPEALRTSLANLRILVEAKVEQVVAVSAEALDRDCAPCTGSMSYSESTPQGGFFFEEQRASVDAALGLPSPTADQSLHEAAGNLHSLTDDDLEGHFHVRDGDDLHDSKALEEEEVYAAPGTFQVQRGGQLAPKASSINRNSSINRPAPQALASEPQRPSSRGLANGVEEGIRPAPSSSRPSSASRPAPQVSEPEMQRPSSRGLPDGVEGVFRPAPSTSRPSSASRPAPQVPVTDPQPTHGGEEDVPPGSIASEAVALFGSLRQLHKLMSERGREFSPPSAEPSHGGGFVYEETKPPLADEDNEETAQQHELSPNDVEWMCHLMKSLTRSFSGTLPLP